MRIDNQIYIFGGNKNPLMQKLYIPQIDNKEMTRIGAKELMNIENILASAGCKILIFNNNLIFSFEIK